MKQFWFLKVGHKRVQQGMQLLVLAGFVVFVGMPASTFAAENSMNRTNGDTTVTAQEAAVALKKTSGVLEASRQTRVVSDNATVLKTASAGATLSISKDAKKGINLEQLGISVSLPNAHKTKQGKTVANATVAYEGTDGSANAVQSNTDGSVRMLTVIDNPSAPTKYDYQLTLPGGGRLQLEEDGGVTIRKTTSKNAEEVVATVARPWAKDAHGKEIQTYYTIQDSTLTQHIRHNVRGVTYPVTADPQISFGWFVYVRLSPADQRFILNNAAGFVPLACVYVSRSPHFIVGCSAAGIVAANWLGTYYNPSRWVEVKLHYNGNFAGIKRL